MNGCDVPVLPAPSARDWHSPAVARGTPSATLQSRGAARRKTHLHVNVPAAYVLRGTPLTDLWTASMICLNMSSTGAPFAWPAGCFAAEGSGCTDIVEGRRRVVVGVGARRRRVRRKERRLQLNKTADLTCRLGLVSVPAALDR